jgi:hypothetical protein
MNQYPKNVTTREGIITNMCYTWDHAFGMEKDPLIGKFQLTGGYTPEERENLWQQMAQIYDGDIAPHHKLKEK